MTVLGEALRRELRAVLTEMIQCGLGDEAELLVVDKHECSHDREAVLSVDLVNLDHGAPGDLLRTRLLPSLKVTIIQVLFLVKNRSLSKNRHSIRH